MASIFRVCTRRLCQTRKPSSAAPTPSYPHNNNHHHTACKKFHTIDSSKLVEEESLPFYKPELFYPAHIGEVLNDKYQIVGKLGYGDLSTVWLCRDLQNSRQYVSLKVCTTEASKHDQEVRVYTHLNSIKSSHPGTRYIRQVYDMFEVSGPHGRHSCLVHPPMHLNLLEFMRKTPTKRLNKTLLKLTLQYLLEALDFLHTEADIVHTDLKSDNIMLSIADESVLDDFSQAEMRDPVPRKIIDETRTIYTSRALRDPAENNWGPPVLCDFGEARIGKIHKVTDPGEAQPHIYRAPEVSFMMPWDSKIDIWNVPNLIWDLFENDHLFSNTNRNGSYCPYTHMAKIAAFLGPPPSEFVARSGYSKNCFDETGKWAPNDAVDIPAGCTLENAEVHMTGKEKELFLHFIRSMLKWLPEERKTASELLQDPWLRL